MPGDDSRENVNFSSIQNGLLFVICLTRNLITHISQVAGYGYLPAWQKANCFIGRIDRETLKWKKLAKRLM